MTFTPSATVKETDSYGRPVYRSEHGETVTVLKDSISEAGDRLTSMEVRFYRGVLAEFNTHRAFSRNSASSRAIPVLKMIKKVLDDPYIPDYWGKYQKGMQAHEEVSNPDEKVEQWLEGRDNAVKTALGLLYGDTYTDYMRKYLPVEVATEVLEVHDGLPDDAVHKQIANRVLEPYMWHTVLVTGTNWDNFFDLRNHEDADPAIYQIAYQMQLAYEDSLPEALDLGQWHLPLLDDNELEEIGIDTAKKISAARCARVSYLTHDGVRSYEADMALFNRLVQGKPHLSPLEHVARPSATGRQAYGNFDGWIQYRGEMFGRTV